MPKRREISKAGGGQRDGGSVDLRLSPGADLTWLLHRAAQRMRSAVDDQAARHGINLRDYIVLTALGAPKKLTQLALGEALGLDKTTMTLELDRLERKGLVIRKPDPRDRRAYIPEATAAGRALRGKVAMAWTVVEARLLSGMSAADQRSLRQMLYQLTELGPDEQLSGSCV